MADQPLSDVDRRTIANLAIPRNVENLTHELRVDPHSPTRSDEGVHHHLQDLEARGWVVKLGEDDVSKYLGKAQSSKQTIDLSDEQVKILERRLGQYRHQWRTTGDQWMLSKRGLDKIKEPTVDSPPMPPSQVQAVIDAEWARTLKDRDADSITPDDNVTLANKLLVDEFTAWATEVADACEKAWGKNNRPRLPMAGGQQLTDAYEIALLDQENQKTQMPALVAPWFMALSILAFTDADTGTTADNGTHIPTYTGYARKSVAAADMNTAAAGAATNANAIIFAGITGGTQQTVIGFAKCIAATVGVVQKYGTTASTVISTTQTPAQFAASAFSTSLD